MAKAVGIDKEAVLVGLVDRFEIWSPERYETVSAVDAALLPEAFKLIEYYEPGTISAAGRSLVGIRTMDSRYQMRTRRVAEVSVRTKIRSGNTPTEV